MRDGAAAPEGQRLAPAEREQHGVRGRRGGERPRLRRVLDDPHGAVATPHLPHEPVDVARPGEQMRADDRGEPSGLETIDRPAVEAEGGRVDVDHAHLRPARTAAAGTLQHV